MVNFRESTKSTHFFWLFNKLRRNKSRHPSDPVLAFRADRAGACRRTSIRPVTAHRPPLVEQNIGPVVNQQRTDVVAVLAQVFHFGVVVQVPLLVVRVPTRGRVMPRLQIGTVMVADGVQVVYVLATTV